MCRTRRHSCYLETKGTNISRTSVATSELLLLTHLFGKPLPHQAPWRWGLTRVVVQPCGKEIPSFKSLVDHIPFEPLPLVVTYTSGIWAMCLTPDKRSLSLPIFSRDQRHSQRKAALQQLLPKLTFHFFATAHFYCHHFHASN